MAHVLLHLSHRGSAIVVTRTRAVAANKTPEHPRAREMAKSLEFMYMLTKTEIKAKKTEKLNRWNG